MKALRLLAALACAALAAGCLVPSLEELESERPRACDADHPCQGGYACLANVCRQTSGLECTPNATEACGQSGGECKKGERTCTAEGLWGACVGYVDPVAEVCDGKDNDCDGATDEDVVTSGCGVDAGVCAGARRACVGGMEELTCSATTYGPDYEAAETRCDGQDNDCDGLTDESLPPQPCPLDAGVCAGATTTCSGGQTAACTQATYSAHDSAYEAVEVSCDGEDNDCDGLTDTWAPAQVTDGGTPVERAVSAVVVPGSGSGARGDVLMLFEVGNRVMARSLAANGTLSAPRFPAVTVTSVQKASAPALGVAGSTMAEAWFEELSTPLYRMPVALAGPAGEAIANGSPGVLPVGPLPGPGKKVVVGLTSQRIVLAYAYADSASASTTTVAVASCPRQLDAACTTGTLGAGKNPALLVEGAVAVVAYESAGRLQLAKVDVPSTGAVTVAANNTFGGSNEHDVVLGGTLAALTLYSIVPGTPDSLWRRAGDCSGACDPAGFTATPSVFTFSGAASALSMHDDGTTRLLAWEEVRAGKTGVHTLDALAATLASSEVANQGRRPVVLKTGAAGFSVFFDSEGATSGRADVVFERRFCGP